MKIKDLNILDIANELLVLKKSGNNYFANCPHHSDTTPSLSITPDKNIWKCFSCGASGGVIELIMFVKNISYKQALLYLAEKYQLKLNDNCSEYMKKRDEINLIHSHFKRILSHTNCKNELEFLKNRGVNEKDFETFGLGTGTQYENVLKAIKEKNYLEFKTDLPFQFERNNKCLFNRRIVMPVEDEYGVANFVGRSIEKRPSLRYLNGTESSIFGLKAVGKCLFNLKNARERINNYNTLVIVEGPFDAIALQKFDNKISVVSTLGCRPTEAQIDLILGLSENIIIFYDGDEAGVEASIELYKRIKEKSKNIKVKIVLNEYELDPEELILKEKNDEVEVVSFYDFVLRNELIESNLKSNIVFENLIYENVKTISDVLLKLSDTLYLDYNLVVKCFENFLKTFDFTVKSSLEFKELYILKSLFVTEKYIRFRKIINPKSFEKDTQKMIKILDDFYKENKEINLEKIVQKMNEKQRKMLEKTLSIKEEYDVKKVILEYLEEKEI